MDESSFVGREESLAEVLAHFSHGDRIVTLIGEAGIGKTRTARRLAHESNVALAAALGEGTPVCWCACEAARDEAAVLRALAVALEVPLLRGDALERLTETLSQRGGLLLVLDHARPAAVSPLVQRLVGECPDLRVLVTARAPVACDAEVCVTVGPLDDESAARLWAANGGRTGDVDDVRAITTALGGVALAIEVAARAAGGETLAARRKALTSCVSAASSPLNGALAFAYAALDPAARRNLAEASVFIGGFSLDAVAAVFTSDGDTPFATVLSELQTRGLANVRDGGAPREVRFELDPATRAFAARELDRFGATARTLARHAAWHLAQAREWSLDHAWRGVAFAAERLLREHDNLTVVAQRSPEVGATPVERALPRLQALVFQMPTVATWGVVDPHLDELEAALDAANAADAPDIELAPAWFVRAWRRQRDARYDLAAAELERVITCAREINRADLHAHALRALAEVRADQGRGADALALADRARVMLEESGRLGESAWAMVLSARLRGADGAHDEARGLLARALARSREHGNVYVEGDALLALGDAELARAQHDAARRYLTEAATAFTRTRRTGELVSVRASLARLQHDLGQTDTAVAEFQRAIELAVFLGDHDRVARLEIELAAVLHEVGQLTEARATLERAHAWLAQRSAAAAATACAYLGAVLASCGEYDAAEERINAARAAVASERDGVITRAARVFMMLARARELPMPDARVAAREARHEVAALKTIAREEPGIELRLAMRMLEGFDGDELLRPSADLARPQAMVAHCTGQWFVAPGGAEVSLRTRSTLSVLLRRLGEQRRESPGRSLSPESLIADMWPGEKIIPKAARNRLHVAVRTLRTMGLNRILRSDIEGYHLDPAVPFQFVGTNSAQS